MVIITLNVVSSNQFLKHKICIRTINYAKTHKTLGLKRSVVD